MAAFPIKRNDRLPYLAATLSKGGEPVNLTDAVVYFVMRPVPSRCNSSPKPVLRAEATVVNVEAGQVEYRWRVGDTAVAGSYHAEFEVVRAGQAETYPDDGYIDIIIRPDLG